MKKEKRPLTPEEIEIKREKEKQTSESMVKFYCHRKHGTKGDNLCDECRELLEYSKQRTDKCPEMVTKTFCAFCKIKCYKKTMHDKMVAVMRYSGPRMLFIHPKDAIYHAALMIKEKRKQKKELRKNKEGQR